MLLFDADVSGASGVRFKRGAVETVVLIAVELALRTFEIGIDRINEGCERCAV